METVKAGEILTSSEVARILLITPDRVRQLVRKGSLRALKTQTGQNIFMKADVEQLKVKRSRLTANVGS
jgi:excisionase family DNA binding protein